MKDMGCDGIKTSTQAQACQMNVNMSDSEVNCQLLVPDENDREEAIESEVTCFKCNGSGVNKKGLPCRKCKSTGLLMSNELSEMHEIVKQEVGEYCRDRFKQMFKEYMDAKQVEQEGQVHEGIECDACGKCPIKGIRFKCAIQSDYDLCEDCERKGINSEHAMVKIRKPSMAPAKIVC